MESEKIAFGKKLDDVRWLEIAEKVISRDERFCQGCASTVDLEVHFFAYPADDPWNVPLYEMTTLCRRCHAIEHATRTAVERLLLNSLEKVKFLSIDLLELLPHTVRTFQSRHERISNDRMRRLGTKRKEISSDPQVSHWGHEELKVFERIQSKMKYDSEFDMSDEFADLQSQFLGMDQERRTLADALVAKVGIIEPPDLPRLSKLLQNESVTAVIDDGGTPRLAES